MGVTIIDEEFYCWYANEQQRSLVQGPCARGLCWNEFHERPADSGPCWGCTVSEVIAKGQERERVFLSRFRDKSARWVRVRTKPVLNREGKTIAGREAISLLDPNTLPVRDRLSGIAQAFLQIGFGQARVFRARGGHRVTDLAAAASITDDFWERPTEYFDSIVQTAKGLNVDNCQYGSPTFDTRTGYLVMEWDPMIGPSPLAEAFHFEPPYMDVPIWNTQSGNLLGWISASAEVLPSRRRSDPQQPH